MTDLDQPADDGADLLTYFPQLKEQELLQTECW